MYKQNKNTINIEKLILGKFKTYSEYFNIGWKTINDIRINPIALENDDVEYN